MRHHTKDLLLKSPLDREHEMMDKINRAETEKELSNLRFLACLDFEHPEGMLDQIKRRENFIKD